MDLTDWASRAASVEISWDQIGVIQCIDKSIASSFFNIITGPFFITFIRKIVGKS